MAFSKIFAVNDSLKSEPNQENVCDIRSEIDEINEVNIKLK